MNLHKSRYKWLLTWGIRTMKPGVAHLAIRGRDFHCEAQSFAGIVYRAAAAMDLKATVSVFTNVWPHQVVFCFFRADAMMRPNLRAYPVVRSLRGE